MTLHLSKSQFPASTNPVRNDANPDPGSGAPDNPTLLNRFAQCCKNIAASAVMKNLAGAMIAAGAGTGAGTMAGCPYVIGLLIAAGVGTSWMGGLGIALIGIGTILWITSTVLSANEPQACKNPGLEIGFSVFMGVIGLPYVIVTHILNFFHSCCCEHEPDARDDLQRPVPGRRPESGKHNNPAGTGTHEKQVAQGHATSPSGVTQPLSSTDLDISKEYQRLRKLYVHHDTWSFRSRPDAGISSNSPVLVRSKSFDPENSKIVRECSSVQSLESDRFRYEQNMIRFRRSHSNPYLSGASGSIAVPDRPPLLSQRLTTNPVIDTTKLVLQTTTLEPNNSTAPNKSEST